VKAVSLKKAQASGTEESRLWREVQVMKDVVHPNLPRLIDVVSNWEDLPMEAPPPHLCIIMEYVQKSEPLSFQIRMGPMPKRAALVVAQLASALCKLHRANIVHRDVWCENVLIGERDKVVLIDFGRSEYLGGRPASNSKLNLPYASPEAAAGLPQQTGDDAWGLGLLLTEMVTGRFIVDRLGRSDVPIHVQRPTLTATIQEAATCAAPVLAQLAAQLLELTAARRPPMVEVVSLLRAATHSDPGRPTSHAAERADRKALNKLRATQSGSEKLRSPLGFRGRLHNCSSPVRPLRHASPIETSAEARASFKKDERPSRHSFGGKSAQFQSPQVNFQPGQTVLYCPGSQAGVLKAIVCGKLADGQGWRIKLESGEFREVEDGEDWRLCLSDLPVASPPAASPRNVPVAAAPAVTRPVIKGPVLAWAPVEVPTSSTSLAPGRSQQVLGSSSTVSSLATATPVSTGTSESSSHPAVSDASPMLNNKGYPITSVGAHSASQAPWAGRTASPNLRRVGSVAGVVPNHQAAAMPPQQGPGPRLLDEHSACGHGPALRCASPPPLASLGRRVLYLSRTGGQRFAGMVTGILPGPNGYRLFLDCGETKDVEEAEAWRISFM